MYYLYIDESGDTGDYNIKNSNIGGSSRFLTLGGIIVNDMTKQEFKLVHQNIISTFFNYYLPSNFKIHYEELRNSHKRKGKSIYSSWDGQKKLLLANYFFDAINKIDCSLLSVSIDLKKHCEKYGNPVNPIAYALYLILERFQYFLGDHREYGEVIYERFGSDLRKKVGIVHKQLESYYKFPKATSFPNINRKIHDGDPSIEFMLQFADFFTYAPWIKCESSCSKIRRYQEIRNKYYNLDHPLTRFRGNYEI